jgi:diguanylate cyclase (GGDEF)-like protein
LLRALGPLVLVALFVPLVFVSRTHLNADSRAQIEFHEQERHGLAYIRPLSALLAQFVRVRAGGGGDVAGGIAAVQAVDERHGRSLTISAHWGQWKILYDRVSAAGRPSFNQYNQLSADLIALVTEVANSSNLILDPDLDSYYLMDAIVVRQSMLLDHLGRAGQLATGAPLDRADRDQVVVARAGIEDNAAAIVTGLLTTVASTVDRRIERGTKQPTADFTAGLARTQQMLTALLDGRPGPFDVSVLLTAMNRLSTAAADLLDGLLADRIEVLDDRTDATTRLVVLVAAMLVLLAGGMWWALRIARRKSGELQHQALHDVLTGLPNRALVLDRVEQALTRARRDGTSLALLFIDLDDFKGVNDTYGHAVGDELLRAVSIRVTEALDKTDTLGRLGGDELVVLAEAASMAGGPEAIAQRVQAALALPFDLPGLVGTALTTHASIGIAVGLRATAADLLRDADVALYAAKAAGKNRFVHFDPQMQIAVQHRLEMEADLRRAVGTDELFLVYQPTVDLETELISGVEALLRWRHPTRGLVMPDVFIPIAEESGLIVPIGRDVLMNACRQAAAWRTRGLRLTIAVNISGRQLDCNSGLVDHVRTALVDSGLEPTSLILELTETMLMKDVSRSTRRLHELKQLGARVAIDDFGTGYCSMAYLQQFPVDALKIDKSFVDNIGHSPEADALIHIFVQLARTFGIESYAEGIEQQSQLRHLQREGCDKGQGYFFARPLPAAALEELALASPGAALQGPGPAQEAIARPLAR